MRNAIDVVGEYASLGMTAGVSTGLILTAGIFLRIAVSAVRENQPLDACTVLRMVDLLSLGYQGATVGSAYGTVVGLGCVLSQCLGESIPPIQNTARVLMRLR